MYKHEPFYSLFFTVENLINRLTVFRLGMAECFGEDLVDEEPQALNEELRQIIAALDRLKDRLRVEGYKKAGEDLPEDLQEVAAHYD